MVAFKNCGRGRGGELEEQWWSKVECLRGGWAAQPVEHPTLDFSSGHDLMVGGSSPASGSTLGVEPT